MDRPIQKRALKACDACKRRKVKCNGQERCQQCAHLGLRCVYSASGKQRSQGKRGHVISEFRKQTATTNATSVPLLPAITAPGKSQASSYESAPQPVGSISGSPTSPTSPFPLQYSKSFFLDLIPDYMEGVYPVQPVIPEHELRQYIHVMDSDQESNGRRGVYDWALDGLFNRYHAASATSLPSLCHEGNAIDIYTQLPHEYGFPGHNSGVMIARRLIWVRWSIIYFWTSTNLHVPLARSLQGSDAAFFYMRDAIANIQLLRIDNAELATTLSPPERSRRQRMYWQAYIHERFIAILDYRHAILPPLYTLPEDDCTIPIQVHEGFNQIIKLFRLLDPEFLQSWLDTQASGSTGTVTSSWVEEKSRELEGDAEADARHFANLSTMQRADLTITREWLRTLVWRLAMGQTLLSSRSSKECLSLLFPIRLSQTLRHQVSNMSQQDIGVHGSSITQKLFEITDTIADVLIHVPAATLDETALRIDDFLFILDFVLLFPQLDHTRRSILLEKLQQLQTMFPEAVSSASSPNVPVEMHSPRGDDPWYQLTQSKMSAGGEEITEAQMGSGVETLGTDVRQGQLSTWNDISKRLSEATF